MAHTQTSGLFRIIGNDLQRNAPGRTLQNVEFILAHETNFPHCTKSWILNRILDPEVERRLIAAIEARGQRHFRIPHDRKAACRTPSASRRERICTVIGINYARNVALSEGRKQFEWTLLLDGHCFVPDAGWDEFTKIASGTEHPYIVVAMERVQTYRDAVLSGPRPKCEEFWAGKRWSVEPQLAFHRTSVLTFDESLPYGDSDKAELLNRLGVTGIWNQWNRPGEPSGRIRSTQDAECAASFVNAGFVIRLPSGNPKADNNSQSRALQRAIGLERLIARLDGRSETLASFRVRAGWYAKSAQDTARVMLQRLQKRILRLRSALSGR